MAEPRIEVTIRYFAAARAAAGVTEEQLSLPAGATVAQALRTAVAGRPGALEKVLARCSFLLDEVAVHGADTTGVRDGAAIDVLPPFAGG